MFSKTGRFRRGGRPWLGFESCQSIVDSFMKCLPVKLKMIFGKNNGQAMEDPQFKFQPVPAESAEGGLIAGVAIRVGNACFLAIVRKTGSTLT